MSTPNHDLMHWLGQSIGFFFRRPLALIFVTPIVLVTYGIFSTDAYLTQAQSTMLLLLALVGWPYLIIFELIGARRAKAGDKYVNPMTILLDLKTIKDLALNLLGLSGVVGLIALVVNYLQTQLLFSVIVPLYRLNLEAAALLSFVFVIVMGIFLSSFWFSPMLVAEGNLGPVAAAKTSCKVVFKHLGKLLFTFVVFGVFWYIIMFLLGALTFRFAFINEFFYYLVKMITLAFEYAFASTLSLLLYTIYHELLQPEAEKLIAQAQ